MDCNAEKLKAAIQHIEKAAELMACLPLIYGVPGVLIALDEALQGAQEAAALPDPKQSGGKRERLPLRLGEYTRCYSSAVRICGTCDSVISPTVDYYSASPSLDIKALCSACAAESVGFSLKTAETVDIINQPPHYIAGKLEVIDIIADQVDDFSSYLQGCIIKYSLRYKYKNGAQDLDKMQWYKNKLIEVMDIARNERGRLIFREAGEGAAAECDMCPAEFQVGEFYYDHAYCRGGINYITHLCHLCGEVEKRRGADVENNV